MTRYHAPKVHQVVSQTFVTDEARPIEYVRVGPDWDGTGTPARAKAGATAPFSIPVGVTAYFDYIANGGERTQVAVPGKVGNYTMAELAAVIDPYPGITSYVVDYFGTDWLFIAADGVGYYGSTLQILPPKGQDVVLHPSPLLAFPNGIIHGVDEIKRVNVQDSGVGRWRVEWLPDETFGVAPHAITIQLWGKMSPSESAWTLVDTVDEATLGVTNGAKYWESSDVTLYPYMKWTVSGSTMTGGAQSTAALVFAWLME
jgi:hypothetical protein